MPTIRTTAMLVAALVVAACTAETIMGDIYRVGVPSEFAYAGGGRDLTTVIVGNPFYRPKDEVETAITDAMQGQHPGPLTHFTTRPGDSARPNYRITIVFNPPINLDVQDLCGDVTSLRSEGRGENLRMLAAFCSHGDVMSYAYGSTRAATSPKDAAVRSLVANVLNELIPVADPLNKGGDSDLQI